MLRTVLVVVHAGAGIVGLVAGLGAVSPERPVGWRRRLRFAYQYCVGVLLAALIALVVVDWSSLKVGARLTFLGLAALGGVMAIRLYLAGRLQTSRPAGWQHRYIAHVYFTYVSLWIGFLILPAIRSPMPQLATPVVVAAVLLVGGVLVGRFRRRVVGAAEHPH